MTTILASIYRTLTTPCSINTAMSFIHLILSFNCQHNPKKKVLSPFLDKESEAQRG